MGHRVIYYLHLAMQVKKNLDTRHKLQCFKLQFEIYLVPTKPLVVPETYSNNDGSLCIRMYTVCKCICAQLLNCANGCAEYYLLSWPN
jgi:hypothetical protein